jgi:hypothetical protein
MSDEIKPASPLPWRNNNAIILDAQGEEVAMADFPNHTGNAKFIVHAANNHARLQARVSELETALARARDKRALYCSHCAHKIDWDSANPEKTVAAMQSHEAACDKNPLQARVAELEAAVRKAAELAWDASGEGFNGEYTPKVVTPKDIDAMLDEVARQALKPEARQ